MDGKALVGAFNQEKALVGAFSVIVKSSQTFEALVTSECPPRLQPRCSLMATKTVPRLEGGDRDWSRTRIGIV